MVITRKIDIQEERRMKNKVRILFSLLLSFMCLATSVMVFSRPVSAADMSITTTSLPDGTVGVPYSATVAVSGGTPPYNWVMDHEPDGLNLNSSTGAFTGTPTQSGTFTVAFTVNDQNFAHIAQQYISITINPMKITTTSLPDGTVGVPYSATLAVSGGTPPYNWVMDHEPDGLNLNSSTGAFTGTPTQSGTFTVAFTVNDQNFAHIAQQYISITINPLSLTITSTSLPAGTINVPYSTTMTAKGGTQPYTWSATGLPGTLSIDSSSGEISGTPTTADTYTGIVISVTDNVGTVASINVDITINSSTLTITTTKLPDGTVGSAYLANMAANGGTGTGYVWSATGLPDGLGINGGTGAITGSPTTSGAYTPDFTVIDSHGNSIDKKLNLTVNPAGPLTITTISLSSGTIGIPYSSTVNANGGTKPYQWIATGLPSGLNIDSSSGNISGTPTAPGMFPVAYQIEVTVKDANGSSVSQDFIINLAVSQTQIPPSWTILVNINGVWELTNFLPDGTVGLSYLVSLEAPSSATGFNPGGTKPYYYGANGLPAGLNTSTLPQSTGMVLGIPTTPGTFTFFIQVQDYWGNFIRQN
jgi:hypothetical protein